MKCPFCRIDNDKVIDSRTSEDGFSIRRRRECQGCSKRFTTYERVAELDMRVVKKDGSRQPFSPDKIRRGLELACWKRPIPTEAVERIICEILQEIYLLGDEEIESERIGEMIMERLFKLDQVAYIRFASVYREFKDVNDFVDGVQPFLFRNNKQRELKP
ncbi:MAG: transcriptional regulator NrdR [Planctomycetota bacterium]|jgi:transcriptional repressor NrdR